MIGVVVPCAHEGHWSQGRSWTRDVAWTVAASTVAAGLFVASHLLATAALGESIHAVPIAFLATVLSGEVIARLLRRRRT